MFETFCDYTCTLLVLSLFAVYVLVNFIIDHSISTEKRKTVLITGCDSGFGFITALELSASNCKVYAGCLTQNGVDKLQEHKEFQGKAFIMDVTKEEDIENAKVMIESEGVLDGIVNNAGIATPGPIEWQSIEQMKNVFEINYWGTVRVVKVMLPLLKKSYGRIINVSSIAGRLASFPYAASYLSSKFAVEAFSDSLRIELRPWKVGVHLIEPSFYKTEIVDKERSRISWMKIRNEQPQHVKDEISEEQVVNYGFNKSKSKQDIKLHPVQKKLEKLRKNMLQNLCECTCWVLLLFSLLAVYMLVNFIIDSSISTERRKTVLITGCDSGFGFITALELSASNCKVYAGCLTQNGVDKLQEHKQFQGKAFIMDVTKEEDIENAKVMIESEGGLDGIVNNAGIATHGPIEWQSIELMRKVFEINYWGTVRVVKVMLSLLKRSNGRIINISSMGGRLSPPYAAPYFCSKFAVEAFSDSLRIELRPWKVGVHLIEPSFYKTEIVNKENTRNSWMKIWSEQPQHVKDEISEEQVQNFITHYYNSLALTEDVREVALKIKHALLARLPRRRYITGRESSYFAFGTHLPTIAIDFMLSRRVPLLSPTNTKKAN